MICEILKLIVEKQSKFIRTAPSRKSEKKEMKELENLLYQIPKDNTNLLLSVEC